MWRKISIVVLSGMVLGTWPVAVGAERITHPYVSLDEMNRRDEKRFEQEQQDRRSLRRDREDAEERASQQRRATACADAKRARKAYVKRLRSKIRVSR